MSQDEHSSGGTGGGGASIGAKGSSVSDAAAEVLGGILKKAVSLGAGAYVTAEDTAKKTLNAVQLPKELLREMVENLFESYTVTVNAEIKLTPKKKNEEKK
jgi:hypothetical protein